jgi:hypothetical protein
MALPEKQLTTKKIARGLMSAQVVRTLQVVMQRQITPDEDRNASQ